VVLWQTLSVNPVALWQTLSVTLWLCGKRSL